MSFDHLKVAELQKELRWRRLPVHGLKRQLRARLYEDERQKQLALDNAADDLEPERCDNPESHQAESEDDDDDSGNFFEMMNDEDRQFVTQETEREKETETETETEGEILDNTLEKPQQQLNLQLSPQSARRTEQVSPSEPSPFGNTSTSLWLWLFSYNAVLPILCLVLRFYNNSSPPNKNYLPILDTYGPVGDFLSFLVFHLLRIESSLFWTLVLICFIIAYTHTEPNACKKLRDWDLIRVRSYLLNATFFYFLVASSHYESLETKTNSTTDIFSSAIINILIGSDATGKDSWKVFAIILSELHQIIGFVLYYACYRDLIWRKKLEVVFNVLAVIGPSLFFLDSFVCTRGDSCNLTAPFDAPLNLQLFPIGFALLKLSWFSSALHNLLRS